MTRLKPSCLSDPLERAQMTKPLHPIALAWVTRIPCPEAPPVQAKPNQVISVGEAARGLPAHELASSARPHNSTPQASGKPNLSQSQSCPEVDEDDRILLDSEALVGAAVVLDVLTTQTQTIEANDSILDSLSAALLEVAAQFDYAPESTEELLNSLRGAPGSQRELISRAIELSHYANASEANPTAALQPKDVKQALEHIETLAQASIREATLIVDPGPLVDYRKV